MQEVYLGSGPREQWKTDQGSREAEASSNMWTWLATTGVATSEESHKPFWGAVGNVFQHWTLHLWQKGQAPIPLGKVAWRASALPRLRAACRSSGERALASLASLEGGQGAPVCDADHWGRGSSWRRCSLRQQDGATGLAYRGEDWGCSTHVPPTHHAWTGVHSDRGGGHSGVPPDLSHRGSLGKSPGVVSSIQWEPCTCSQCAARESCQESSHSHIACFWCWRPEAQAQRATRRTPAPGKVGAAQETGENFTFHLPDTVCAGDVLRTSASL